MNFRHIILGALASLVPISAAHATEVCTALADSNGPTLFQRGDCQRQVTAASTFKIAISLMGYDAGILKDQRTPKLPFREGYVDWRADWRQDTDPTMWMTNSVVWYSQQVTQQLGMQRFAAYTSKFKYGNANVAGDAEHDGLTLSWISSSLKISPLEQLTFLNKVVNRQLGVSAHAYDMTARLTQRDQPLAGWRIHGKTGAASGYGWYVGWATKGKRSFSFAHLMQRDDTQPKEVSTGVLAREALLKELPLLLGSVEQEAMLRETVDQTIEPLMKKYDVPGMALALTDHGKNYVFNYGLASRETRQPVDRDTLFEVGSVSKTLVATLATYAQAQGRLALSDKVSQHMPALRGSSFDHINLIHLGTHTAGEFPMHVPDNVKNYDQLMDYYRSWQQPASAAGASRTYSNLTIGLLGMISAQSMGLPIADAMEKQLLPALGMRQTYIKVPADQMTHYAQGYNDANAPVRVHPAVLEPEAYGIKTTAADLIRFVDANLGQAALDDALRQAVEATHIGYFKLGAMTQDLIWEQYPAAAGLPGLLVSASEQVTWKSNPVTPLTPPLAPQADALLHKTGSTGGFGAYVLFSPGRKTGIVMLANKFYPGAARIEAAYRILSQLEQGRQ